MTRGCEWHHAPEAWAEDFRIFEKSQYVESCRPKNGDFLLLAKVLRQGAHVFEGCVEKSV